MHFMSQVAQPTNGIQRIWRLRTQACGGNTIICAIVSQVEVCFHIVDVRTLARDVLAAFDGPVESAEYFRESDVRLRPGAREAVTLAEREPPQQYDHEAERDGIDKKIDV